MKTAIIIDDELESINYLKEILLELDLDITLVGISQNSKEGLELIETLKPDIVFLDIQLKGDTGFDLLKKTKTKQFNLIFTTAYEQFAVKAIKFAAIDYLLKPIDKLELQEAINRIQSREIGNTMEKNFAVFLENFEKNKRQKIAISTVSTILVVDISDIIYCEASGPYTTFYLKNEKDRIVSSKHLKEYEELLTEHNFLRIHKSYLINIMEVKQYIKSDGGMVLLSNNMKVDVSEKKKQELMNVLAKGIHFLK